MVQRLVKNVQRTYFNYQVERNRHLFQDVNTFVIFIGYPHSGHSLVGSLLDAHPNAIISHELHVLKRLHQGCSQEQLFYLIYQSSRENARQGREETGYSYRVPGQWQGKYTQLKIIGDKKGGKTAELLAVYPQMLDELFRSIKYPVKFIHVLRNPFDNITSMILRGEDTGFDTAIPRYFKMVDAVVAVKNQVGNALIDIYHEDLIQSPRETIIRLCNFLNLPVPDDYINACASIMHSFPNQTRQKVEWPTEQLDRVSQHIARYDFLQDYSFEC